MDDRNSLSPVEVPSEAISPEALANLIDSFILREGTDYGAQELEHEAKVRRVQKQLQAGEIKIAFDPNSESVTLVTRQEWNHFQSR